MSVKSSLRIALLSTVALGAMPCIANAADLPVKAPYQAPASFSWTGFYVGASLGGVQHSASTDYGAANAWDTGYSGGPVNSSAVGGIAGGQIGYNYQIRNFVIGVEGDLSGLFGTSKTLSGGWPDCGAPTCLATASTEVQGFASVRARFGFDIMNGTLVYATTGIGWMKLNDNFNVTGTSGKNGNFSSTKWAPAFVAGGGIEQRINNNWSVRGEVLWAKSETTSASPTDLSYFSLTTPAVNYSHELVIVRIGLNYLF